MRVSQCSSGPWRAQTHTHLVRMNAGVGKRPNVKLHANAGVWSRRSAWVCMPSSGVWGGTNLCQREKNLDMFIQAQKLLQILRLKSTLFFLLRFPSTSQSPSYSQPETLPDAMIAGEKQLITGVAGDAQTNICARHTEPRDWNTLSL